MKIKSCMYIGMLIVVSFIIINISEEVKATGYTVGPDPQQYDFTTLRAALDSGLLSSGDTVTVHSTAPETGSFSISVSSLTIIGSSALARAPFEGLNGQDVFNITTTGVKLINLDISGYVSSRTSVGVRSTAVCAHNNKVEIKNCKIHRCTHGVIIEKDQQGSYPRNNAIIECEIYENNYGITINSYVGSTSTLWGIHQISLTDIHDNYIDSGAGYGIYISGWHNDILGCELDMNAYGIYLVTADYTDIIANDTTGNSIYDNNWGLYLYDTDHCQIESTSLTSNGQDSSTYTLRLIQSSYNTFDEIVISENDNNAIQINGNSDYNKFDQCSIDDNDNGVANKNHIYIYDSSDYNEFNTCEFGSTDPVYSDLYVYVNCDYNNFSFSTGYPLITIYNCDNNEIYDCVTSGISLTECDGSKILFCTIDDTDDLIEGAGIDIDNSPNTYVRSSDISNVEYGIIIDTSEFVVIHGDLYSDIDSTSWELRVLGLSTLEFHAYSLSNYGSNDICIDGGDNKAIVDAKNIENEGSLDIYLGDDDDYWLYEE